MLGVDGGGAEDAECRPKHVFCFFMCHDTPPKMARFYWLLAFLFGSIALFFIAHAVARSWGYSHQFGVIVHVVPLLVVALAHVPLLGMNPEEVSYRDPNQACDPMMMRIVAMTAFLVIGAAFAFSITVDRWWSDPMTEEEFVHGHPPEHASPSSTPKPKQHDQPLGKLFGSPSKTPSQTPTSSPDPEVLRRQFQRSSDDRSVIGILYMGSVGCAVGTVISNYMLRTVLRFQ